MPYCPSCHEKIDAGATRCGKCLAVFPAESAIPDAAPTAAAPAVSDDFDSALGQVGTGRESRSVNRKPKKKEKRARSPQSADPFAAVPQPAPEQAAPARQPLRVQPQQRPQSHPKSATAAVVFAILAIVMPFGGLLWAVLAAILGHAAYKKSGSERGWTARIIGIVLAIYKLVAGLVAALLVTFALGALSSQLGVSVGDILSGKVSLGSASPMSAVTSTADAADGSWSYSNYNASSHQDSEEDDDDYYTWSNSSGNSYNENGTGQSNTSNAGNSGSNLSRNSGSDSSSNSHGSYGNSSDSPTSTPEEAEEFLEDRGFAVSVMSSMGTSSAVNLKEPHMAWWTSPDGVDWLLSVSGGKIYAASDEKDSDGNWLSLLVIEDGYDEPTVSDLIDYSDAEFVSRITPELLSQYERAASR